MARNLSFETAAEVFDSMVKEELQSAEQLAGTCMEFHSYGENLNIPYFAPLDLVQSDFGSGGIPTFDPTQSQKTIEQSDYNLKTVIGKAYETLFAYDVLSGHAAIHAKALGRRIDTLKIDAAQAIHTYDDANFNGTEEVKNHVVEPESAGIRNSIYFKNSDANTVRPQITAENLSQAIFKACDNGADPADLTIWIGWGALHYLFDTQSSNGFVSFDYQTRKPMSENPSKGYMFQGIPVLPLANAKPGSDSSYSTPNKIPVLTDSGTPSHDVHEFLVVDSKSLAIGFNRLPSSVIVEEPSNDRTSVLSTLTAGAVATRDNGIILAFCSTRPVTTS